MPQSFSSIVKIGDFILSSPILSRSIVPISKGFVKLSGYKKLGLRFDDLLMEETPLMQKAIRRLPQDESYSRIYRIIRAHQCEVEHKLLDKKQWTKNDRRYLLPYILEAEREAKEKEDLDHLTKA